MKAELVRIGNSRGIRIPKAILEQCRLRDTVDLRVEEECLVISAKRAPRQGWNEAFSAAGPANKDPLLLDSIPASEFDREEWRW